MFFYHFSSVGTSGSPKHKEDHRAQSTSTQEIRRFVNEIRQSLHPQESNRSSSVRTISFFFFTIKVQEISSIYLYPLHVRLRHLLRTQPLPFDIHEAHTTLSFPPKLPGAQLVSAARADTRPACHAGNLSEKQIIDIIILY